MVSFSHFVFIAFFSIFGSFFPYSVDEVSTLSKAELSVVPENEYLAQASPFQDGTIIALQSDTGGWLSRCRNCQTPVDGVKLPDTVSTHRTNPDAGNAQFEVVDVGGGKFALKSDTGNYLSRCRGCILDGVVPDFLTIHVTNPNVGHAQFTPVKLNNGKYALRTDTGKYVSRCNGCSPTSVTSDTVTVHVDDPLSKPHAQWDITICQ